MTLELKRGNMVVSTRSVARKFADRSGETVFISKTLIEPRRLSTGAMSADLRYEETCVRRVRGVDNHYATAAPAPQCQTIIDTHLAVSRLPVSASSPPRSSLPGALIELPFAQTLWGLVVTARDEMLDDFLAASCLAGHG